MIKQRQPKRNLNTRKCLCIQWQMSAAPRSQPGRDHSDNVPLTPSTLSCNKDLVSVHSNSQITESPQTSPQIPGQIHSPVENQQRQSSGGLPTHRPAHPLPQALTLAWFKRLPLKTPTVINTLPFSCCFFFFIPTILGWLLNPMLAQPFPYGHIFSGFLFQYQEQSWTIRRMAEGQALTF